MLNRREVIIRKLLTKYHDDKDYMKKTISSIANSFDPHLAERVRSKHPRSYSREEKEWASVDRILHPEVWKYYVHRDENFLDRHVHEAKLPMDMDNRRGTVITTGSNSSGGGTRSTINATEQRKNMKELVRNVYKKAVEEKKNRLSTSTIGTTITRGSSVEKNESVADEEKGN
jgi:hypothetical protein